MRILILNTACAPRVFVALLVAILPLTASCRDAPDRPKTDPAPAATAIEPDDLVTVTREPISTGPPISGELRASREATVRAEVAGSVYDVTVEEGQPVRRGQVLCRIDAPALRDSVASAEVGVRSATAGVAAAEREQQRTAALVAEGLVPRRDLESAQQSVADARARLADAQARQATSSDQSAKRTVRAPLAGVVSKRAANAGDVVAIGAPLVTIIDPSSLQFEASVPSDSRSAVRLGVPVEFRTSGDPEQRFHGRIDRISPTADPVTRQVRIYVSVPNTSRQLVAGLFAEGRIAAASRDGLVVPTTAVETNDSGAWVSRVRAGRVERVPVAVGLRDERDARVEIRFGVEEGDAILTGAAQTIPPGTPVSVRGDTRAAALW
jgi:membrane fusion protein (multidrug efflux system)